MAYDWFLFCLTAAGVLSVVVCSYKIFHSRVYPIGIVRRPHASRRITEEDVLFDEFQHPDLQTCNVETGLRTETMKYFGVSDETLRRLILQSWRQSKKPFTGKPSEYVIQQLRFDLPPQEPPAEKEILEKKVAEYERTLKNLEKRIRRLEVQSVLESQESSDRPKTPESERVH